MSDQFKYVHDEAGRKVYRFPKEPQIIERRAGRGKKVIGHDVRMEVDFKELFADAWAFLTDPDSRKLSRFAYPSGAGMSVRVAKQRGLL